MRQFRGSITRPGSRMRDVYASCRPYPAPAGTRKIRLRLVASLLLPLRCLWHLTPCIRTALKSRSPFTCGLGLDPLLFALSAFTESVSPKSFKFDLPHLIIPFLWIYLGAIQTRHLCRPGDADQQQFVAHGSGDAFKEKNSNPWDSEDFSLYPLQGWGHFHSD